MSLTPSKPFKSKLTKKNLPLNHPGRNTHTHTPKKNDLRIPKKKHKSLGDSDLRGMFPFYCSGEWYVGKILDPNTLDSHGSARGQQSLWGMVISPVKLG